MQTQLFGCRVRKLFMTFKKSTFIIIFSVFCVFRCSSSSCPAGVALSQLVVFVGNHFKPTYFTWRASFQTSPGFLFLGSNQTQYFCNISFLTVSFNHPPGFYCNSNIFSLIVRRIVSEWHQFSLFLTHLFFSVVFFFPQNYLCVLTSWNTEF